MSLIQKQKGKADLTIGPVTHEGAEAARITPEEQLRRSVMACMLWESGFYESGQEIADRISSLISQVDPETVMNIAVEAREKMKLRHVPLLIAVKMTEYPAHRAFVAATVERIIQRADELAEILAIYAKGRNGTKTLNKLSKQLRIGIARAFLKFNEYALAKYNQKGQGVIQLRDVLFLSHAKPKDPEQKALWERLISGTLATPDTWEVKLSATRGENKKEAWIKLLSEQKLGALALIRNLRNMQEAAVPNALIKDALGKMSVARVLPYRFITAARYAPTLEPELEAAMFRAIAELPKLPGKTAIVVDHSASMDSRLSGKSEMSSFEAASALAILARELSDDCVVVTFGQTAMVVPARRGFALRDAMKNALVGHSTMTQLGIDTAAKQSYDRIIVITDEQSHQRIHNPVKGSKGYFINVAAHQHGIGYGEWTHMDGFSEAVLAYIQAAEETE